MRVLPAILTLLAVFPGWALAQSSGERIKALDKIRMTCLEESALNKTYKVTKDGVILVDFLGAVEIGGLTEEEAGKLISNKLVNDRILRDATVSVVRVNSEGTGSTTTPPALSVKLSGAFREQKSIPHQEGLKLSTVVQTADATADLTKVKVKSFDGLIVTYDCTKPETDVSLKA
ncbi:MAG: polysaccharide biosynthesis/export family protein, partial [Chthonomonadaceae bacterium]|nr:polysaccharide biosynthesis/export family protein [Chthonomonadaceae bacterium]